MSSSLFYLVWYLILATAKSTNQCSVGDLLYGQREKDNLYQNLWMFSSLSSILFRFLKNGWCHREIFKCEVWDAFIKLIKYKIIV